MGKNLLLPEKEQRNSPCPPPRPLHEERVLPKALPVSPEGPLSVEGQSQAVGETKEQKRMRGEGSELRGTEAYQRNGAEAVAMGGACLARLCALRSKAGNPWGGHGVRGWQEGGREAFFISQGQTAGGL